MESKKKNPFWEKAIPAILFIGIIFLNGCNVEKQEKKGYRIGILSGSSPFENIADGFKTKMAEIGYIEGKNIVYDLHTIDVDPEGGKRILKKFVDDKVDLIFAFPTGPALSAKAAAQSSKIPVLFAFSTIEDNNLVDSIGTPGGHITGVRFPNPELTAKRFELLLEFVPYAKRVYILYDPNYPSIPYALAALRRAILDSSATLIEAQVTSLKEIQAELDARSALDDIGVDAILIMPEILSQSADGWAMISKFAGKHKLPVAGSAHFETDAGAIFSYIPDNIEVGKLAAPLADKIFKGIPAGTIPVVTPNSIFRINYKSTQALGLKVSEDLLAMADEIIR